jgi:hypothetical protein
MIYPQFVVAGSSAVIYNEKRKPTDSYIWTSKSLNRLNWGSLDKTKVYGSISIASIKEIYAGCDGAKSLYNSLTIESDEGNLLIEVGNSKLRETWTEALRFLMNKEIESLSMKFDFRSF